MHLEAGTWSVNVTVFGAWAPGLDYTLSHLARAPAELAPRRRMIEHDGPGGPWFSLIEVTLPVSEHRAVPVALHVAAVTGTFGSEHIERHLFECADVVVFYAETVRYQLDRSQWAREHLDPYDGIVVVQLDHPYLGRAEIPQPDGTVLVEDPMVELDPPTLLRSLRLEGCPVVETWARDHRLNHLFRVVLEQVLPHRDGLPSRPAYAKSTGAC
ncbi:MAG: hypothetical protein ABI867_01115 [Kofleriaceae bacterium]